MYICIYIYIYIYIHIYTCIHLAAKTVKTTETLHTSVPASVRELYMDCSFDVEICMYICQSDICIRVVRRNMYVYVNETYVYVLCPQA